MRVAFKILAITLLAGLVATVLASSVLPAPASALSPPAGCHRHSGKVPAPAPVSYRCCQTGHGSILLQESPVFRPLVFCGSLLLNSSSFAFVTTSSASVRYQIIPSSSPPSNIPQRI